MTIPRSNGHRWRFLRNAALVFIGAGLVVRLLLVSAQPVGAGIFDVAANIYSAGIEKLKEIFTPTAVQTEDVTLKRIEDLKSKKEDWTESLKTAAATALKAALSHFVNTLAYDTATKLASGGRGQQPLFETEGWGAYLQNTADEAAGSFIETFAKADPLKSLGVEGLTLSNLCAPKFDLRLRIGLGLLRTVRPRAPACTWTKFSENWKTAISDPQFLERIAPSFNPWENEAGIALGVYTNFYNHVFNSVEVGRQRRIEGQGFRPVETLIGQIKTPARTVGGYLDTVISKGIDKEFAFTGEVLADGVGTFVSTLTGKLAERLFEKGLAGSASTNRFDWSRLEGVVDARASSSRGSRADAQREFASLLTANAALGDPTADRVAVTSLLLNEGVINASFKQAIDRGLTVREAIDEGLLVERGAGSTFAYSGPNQQPDARSGYSHNSMIILRKYRILPVGWELAAAYVGKQLQGKVYSLGDVVGAYDDPDSPFYHLLDQHWVLKVPDTYCRLQAPTDSLSSDGVRRERVFDTSVDPPVNYDFDRRQVSRDTECIDLRSCIAEDGRGNCVNWGLCTEEEPIWRFDAESCPAHYVGCTTYAPRTGGTVSYLSGTVVSDSCNSGNVGCGWLCTEYNSVSGEFACVAEGERVTRTCESPAPGCVVTDAASGRSCTIPPGGTSCSISACSPSAGLVVNGDFEAQSPSLTPSATLGLEFAEGWYTTAAVPAAVARVSGAGNQVFSGRYSVRVFADSAASQVIANSADVVIAAGALGAPDRAYTLSGYIYSTLAYGAASLRVVEWNPAANAPVLGGSTCSTDPAVTKSNWASVTCELSVPSTGGTYRLQLVVDNTTNDGGRSTPVGTVWFDSVSFQASCPTENIIVSMVGTLDESGSKLFLDDGASNCQASQAGCTQLIRLQPNLGTNLIPNPSFERLDENGAPEGWTSVRGYTLQTDAPTDGQRYLQVAVGAVGDLSTTPLVGMTDATFYRVSFAARSAGGGTLRVDLLDDDPATTDQQVPFSAGIALTGDWVGYISDPVQTLVGRSGFRLGIGSTAAITAELDSVMVEAITQTSGAFRYAGYGSSNAVGLKLPPAYLNCTGDSTTDDAACGKYAGACTQSEVGCQRYTPTGGGTPIPGVISSADLCPAECVGYTAFKQSATNFETEKFPLYFIETTANRCDANDAGCEEFTNLDTVVAGGEGREYYSYVRQCSKPNPSICGTFYSWVGSDVSGYQLRVHNLRRDRADTDGDGDLDEATQVANPLLNIGSLGPCATEADAASNPNCRQLFSATGAESFVYFQQTVTCDEGCHPYRLADSTQLDCEGSGGFWGTCALPVGTTCESLGGMQVVGSGDCYTTQAACGARVWSIRNQCVYQFLSTEGRSCSTAAAGCREYRGNAGANIHSVYTDGFEDGDYLGWIGNAISISTEATNRGGHSLRAQGPQTLVATLLVGGLPRQCDDTLVACASAIDVNCYDGDRTSADFGICRAQHASGQRCAVQSGQTYCGTLGQVLEPGKSYLVSFWAKTASGRVEPTIPKLRPSPDRPVAEQFFVNLLTSRVVTGAGAGEPSLRINPDWQAYTLPPVTVPDTLPSGASFSGADLQLFLDSGGQAIFIDAVEIKEVQEYSYLIKNSWRTPQSCDTNPALDSATYPVPNAPQFMLGCASYTSSGGGSLNLKSFTRLCRDSAVGCEAFLDTHNSESPFAETFNTGSGASEVRVPADTLVTAVNDPRFACGLEVAGCTALGRPTLDARTGEVTSYQTVYRLNRPTDYATSLCTADAVGCDAYTSEDGQVTYFKNPGNRTCEYRAVSGSEQYGWFVTGSSSAAPDCPTTARQLGNVQPAALCQGGDRAGQTCGSDADCGVRVCRGGGDEGTRCSVPGDCSSNVCELSAGICARWAGVCPASAATCTAYIDPLSANASNQLPNGNFEGTFKVCSNGITACTTDADCRALPPIAGATQACDQRKLYFWADALPPMVKPNLGRVNSTAVELAAGSSISQSRSLDDGTLYSVSLWAAATSPGAKLELVANTDDAFADFDHSLQIDAAGRTLTLLTDNAATTYQRFSGRFLTLAPLTGVTVRLTGPGRFEDVTLAVAGVYYQLAKEIDRQSCNGIVNDRAGCVLFNDTSDPVLKFSSTASQADQPPANCDGGTCDSNLLVQVRPDRQCAKWLDCVASRDTVNPDTGEKISYCQRLATCDRINPANGKCASYPADQTTPVEYNAATVDAARYVTGYSTVGYTWTPEVSVTGLLPYAVMPQLKVCVAGDPAKLEAPCLEDAECNSAVAFSTDGSCQPVLKVRGEADPLTVYESCRAYPEADSPRWGEFGPADTGSKPAKSLVVDALNPLPSVEGRSPQDLAEASECRYVKEITRYEGLYGFCVEGDPRNPYRCLTWLPVDELTGGWTGDGWAEALRKPLYYCSEGQVLEARTPDTYTVNKCYKGSLLDPGFALTDFVSDAIGVGGGPGDASGVPYTIASSSKCGNVACPVGYRPNVRDADCSTTFQAGRRCYWECIPDQTDLYRTDSITEGGTRWYEYHDRVDRTGKSTKKHIIYCPTCGSEGRVMWDPENPGQDRPAYWLRTCSKVVKVAQEDGSNVGWKERLEVLPEFSAANYEVPNLRFTLDTEATPFGAVGAKYAGDPASWSLIEERVPASAYRSPKLPDYLGGDAGQPYFQTITRSPVTSWGSGLERLKRLFAVSYGYYLFTGSSYSAYTLDSDQYCHGGPKNGISCAADPAVCADPGSRCDQAGGLCVFQNTQGTPEADDDAWVQSKFASCSGNADCATSAAAYCATGYCRVDDGNDENDTNKPCNSSGQCALPETCSSTTRRFGYCSGGPPFTYTCLQDADCVDPRDGVTSLGTCVGEGTRGFCSTGLRQSWPCDSDAFCSNLGSNEFAFCVGRCQDTSVRRGRSCINDTQCAISGECRTLPAWQPPAQLCPNRTRPTSFTDDSGALIDLDPNNNADWCAIAPVVYNLKIENSEAPVFQITGGSGAVSVAFNVRADSNQLPLRLLQVDWGDGVVELPSVPALGFNHRPDPRSPFSYTHTYTYRADCDTGSGFCSHTVRVRVRDNWSWWSADGGYDPNPSVYPDSAWVTVPAEVQVYQ